MLQSSQHKQSTSLSSLKISPTVQLNCSSRVIAPWQCDHWQAVTQWQVNSRKGRITHRMTSRQISVLIFILQFLLNTHWQRLTCGFYYLKRSIIWTVQLSPRCLESVQVGRSLIEYISQLWILSVMYIRLWEPTKQKQWVKSGPGYCNLGIHLDQGLSWLHPIQSIAFVVQWFR